MDNYINKLRRKYFQYLCVPCYSVNVQEQPSIGVLQKRYSAKTQQIYRRLPMKKYDFNKAA